MARCLLGVGLAAGGPVGVGAVGDGPAAREVAELRDGRRVTGMLVEGPEGEVVFLADSVPSPIAADRIARVLPVEPEGAGRSAGDPRPFLLMPGFDERLSGELIALEGDTIRFALGPDEEPLRVDRRGVGALVQRPGEAQVFADRFEEPEPRGGWTLGDGVRIAEAEGRDGSVLSLEPGGAEARLRLPEPIAAGRVELAFAWSGRRAAGHRWFVDLIFDGPNGEEITRVVLGWADEFPSVESRGGPEIVVQPLVLEPGWHRLSARFGPGRTLLTIDGNDLGRGGGPRGALVALRVRTEAGREAEEGGGLAARVDDLQVVRSFEPTTSPDVDPTQDEMRLVSGDQVWGEVVSADAEGVVLRVLGRTVEGPWSRVAGLYFRRPAIAAGPIEGLLVRAQWEVGDPESRPDRIEGALVGVGPGAVRVETAFAGTIAVPRDRLRALEFLGRGRRLVIDPHARHLGDQLMPEFDPPLPDGDEHELVFTIDAIPGGAAELVVDALHVEGEFDGGRFADEIRAGYQRTNLRLNGEVFDYLNRHVRDANRAPARLRVPIPAGLLRIGENRLRFEQLGREQAPSFRDDLALLRVALEWPEPSDAAP